MASLLTSRFFLRRIAAACAIAATASSSAAQTVSLQGVSVVAQPAPVLQPGAAGISGWDVQVARTPQSISVLGADLLQSLGTASLYQAVRLDASLADSYNTTGYLENLSVRGFLLDTAANYQRSGLPTSNLAPVALESKERIEVLKGIAGLQAGVSAPGGLVNWVTKQPLREPFTTATIQTDSEGGSKLHLDASRSIGSTGVRVNLVSESLRPVVPDAQGSRQLFSMAVASRLNAYATVTLDAEYQRKRQPSVPGLGLLDTDGDGVADALPARIPTRLNINNQTWSQPFEFEGSVAQLAFKHQLRHGWEASAAVSWQRSSINDRLAFPDGCGSAPSYVYPGLCANGDVDVYDYRSEGEVRSQQVWSLLAEGPLQALSLAHRLGLGLSARQTLTDLGPMQAYNYVGTTNIFSPVRLPADANLTSTNTDSREATIDGSLRLTTTWSPALQSFAGLRAVQLQRSSVRSDGTEGLELSQTVSTPWIGAAWTFAPGTTAYASWGQGVELEVVPNRPLQFANPGAVLPALRSTQSETGVKWAPQARLLLTVAAFQIDKPFADDLAQPNGTSLRVGGGKLARHRGLEFSAAGSIDRQWSLQASVAWLEARYVAALTPGLVDKPVTNVPKMKASLFVDYKLAAVPGLSMHTLLVAESGKTANASGSVKLPDSWQLDAGLNYRAPLAGKSVTWRLQVDNLTDRIYWREAPTQSWGGAYLFASTPRTVRLSAGIDF